MLVCDGLASTSVNNAGSCLLLSNLWHHTHAMLLQGQEESTSNESPGQKAGDAEGHCQIICLRHITTATHCY